MCFANVAGTLPTGLATSTNVAVLDVHQNNLTGLPDEWLQGFTGAADTSFQQIYLQDNQLEVRVAADCLALCSLCCPRNESSCVMELITDYIASLLFQICSAQIC